MPVHASALSCTHTHTHTHTHQLTLLCALLPPPLLSISLSLSLSFLWCTLRQVSAELLRRQAGKQAHQQRGRGAVSLMSSKAVSNTRIAMSSCICAHVHQPRVHGGVFFFCCCCSCYGTFSISSTCRFKPSKYTACTKCHVCQMKCHTSSAV